MREIKFRAWDKKNKRWVSHNSLLNETEVSASVLTPPKLTIKHPNWDIMQYTGFTDINNTEIYEGDIVKFEIPFHIASTKIARIFFENGAFKIDLGIKTDFLERYANVGLEVVGNIYETPELLKDIK
ncbi:YopX family protein [Campylobacter mucosalis]|uniref:YopX family protein n=1 Tax=Campylobacter mucosalis TaxID=202 RepID=UPI00147046AD|nr:YopX family protein [Campylobacter mucosalis]